MALAHVTKVITGAAGRVLCCGRVIRTGVDCDDLGAWCPATDVLAQHAETGRLIAVQTKTAGPGMTDFQLRGSTKIDVDADGIGFRSVTRSPPRPTTSGLCLSG
jgi:hypothetical protein